MTTHTECRWRRSLGLQPPPTGATATAVEWYDAHRWVHTDVDPPTPCGGPDCPDRRIGRKDRRVVGSLIRPGGVDYRKGPDDRRQQPQAEQKPPVCGTCGAPADQFTRWETPYEARGTYFGHVDDESPADPPSQQRGRCKRGQGPGTEAVRQAYGGENPDPSTVAGTAKADPPEPEAPGLIGAMLRSAVQHGGLSADGCCVLCRRLRPNPEKPDTHYAGCPIRLLMLGAAEIERLSKSRAKSKRQAKAYRDLQTAYNLLAASYREALRRNKSLNGQLAQERQHRHGAPGYSTLRTETLEALLDFREQARPLMREVVGIDMVAVHQLSLARRIRDLLKKADGPQQENGDE